MIYLFDIGNVLVDVNLTSFSDELKKFIHPDHDPMFFLETMQAMHETGHLTMNQALWSHHDIAEKDREYLLEKWNLTISRNDKMISLLKEISQNYNNQIILVSNIGFEHAKYLEKICPELFEPNIKRYFSYEVGARKPSRIFFQSLFMDKIFKEKAKLNAYVQGYNVDVCYIDDRKENLEAACNTACDNFTENGLYFHIQTINFCLNKRQDVELSEITIEQPVVFYKNR